jgi:hypothetical protein
MQGTIASSSLILPDTTELNRINALKTCSAAEVWLPEQVSPSCSLGGRSEVLCPHNRRPARNCTSARRLPLPPVVLPLNEQSRLALRQASPSVLRPPSRAPRPGAMLFPQASLLGTAAHITPCTPVLQNLHQDLMVRDVSSGVVGYNARSHPIFAWFAPVLLLFCAFAVPVFHLCCTCAVSPMHTYRPCWHIYWRGSKNKPSELK